VSDKTFLINVDFIHEDHILVSQVSFAVRITDINMVDAMNELILFVPVSECWLQSGREPLKKIFSFLSILKAVPREIPSLAAWEW
jgi:predicted AlkP superfamily pyrophosphatase or phosphodiesterase